MFRRTTTAWSAAVVLALAVILCAPAGAAEPARAYVPEKLPLEKPAFATEISEDGAWLALAHFADDRVTVWDVAGEKVAARIKTPAPRGMLFRGGRLLVINDAKQTISVFDPKRKWELVNELEIGGKGAWHLAAPPGEAYAGKLIAATGEEGWIIDVARDEHKPFEYLKGIVTFSGDGKYMVNVTVSTSTDTPIVRPADPVLRGEQVRYTEGEHEEYPAMFQLRPDGWWFGGTGVFCGIVPRAMDAWLASMVLPDRTRRLIYTLSGGTLTARRLDAAFTPVGKVKLQAEPAFIRPYAGSFAAFRASQRAPRDIERWQAAHIGWGYARAFDRPMIVLTPQYAVTAGGHLHVFLHDAAGGTVTWYKLPTFAVDETAAASADWSQQKELGEALRFSPVPTPEPATTFCFSEDGRMLVVAHESGNRLTVWDAAAGKQVANVRCQSPRYVICRGGRLYAVNFGKGTISAFDAKTWQMLDVLDGGDATAYYLSAPAGEAFDGKLLVTTAKAVYILDTATDKVSRVDNTRGGAAVTPDVLGRYIMDQDGPSVGIPSRYAYAGYVAGDKGPARRIPRGPSPKSILQQHHPLPYWFSALHVFNGDTMTAAKLPVADGKASLLVPDVARRAYYIFDGSQVHAWSMDSFTHPTSLGKCATNLDVKAELPASEIPWLTSTRTLDSKTLVLHPPQASTIGDRLVMCVYSNRRQSLMWAACKAPGGADIRVAVAGPGPQPPGQLPEGLPDRVPAGAEFRCRLPGEGPASHELLSGPDGIAVSNDGVLIWTPRAGDVGRHIVKIRSQRGDEVRFFRYAVTVVQPVAGAPAAAGPLGVHRLLPGAYHLAYAHDHGSLLLANATELTVLDAEGLNVQRRSELPQPYHSLLTRKDHLLALGDRSLDLLDPKTLTPKRRIKLDCDAVQGLAAHPFRPICYVAVKDSDPATRNRVDANRVLEVDETSGKIRKLEDIYGQYLAADPRGRMLYVGLHATYHRGYRIDWYFGDLVKVHGSFDLLAAYNIIDDEPLLFSATLSPGADGSGVVVAPDGRAVSYVSRNGYIADRQRSPRWAVPVYQAGNLREPSALLHANGPVFDVAYHPMLDLAAVADEKGLRFFDSKIGRTQEGLLDLDARKLSEVKRVWFSPGGRHLLLEHRHAKHGRVLEAFPLKLTAEQRRQIPNKPAAPEQPKPPVDPDAARPPAVAKIARDDIDALAPTRDRGAMTPKQIGERYMDAIVVIETATGMGTGFLIGQKGMILTCAHTLSRIGQPLVTYRTSRGDEVTRHKAYARVVHVDRNKDLALLAIDLKARPPNIPPIGGGGKLSAGENTTVIGHPGLGEVSLEYTMTTGIVSTRRRDIEKQPYVQTSAAVNPGNSGGPMFDSHGRVIGVIVLKARIEGTAFAVPVKTIRKFLDEAVRKSR